MFVKVRVPATSANLGPGFDVAGLAVTLYNTFTFELLDEGLAKNDLNLIGKACTYSGLANENIHKKPFLEKIIDISDKYGCYGVNIAHSGTVIGILMHREMDDIRLIEYLREDEMSKYYKKIYTSDIIDGKVREEEEWNILKTQK